MRTNSKLVTIVGLITFAFVVFYVSGCNRSTLRASGASTPFPETATNYKVKKGYPFTMVVETPVDQRLQHFGEVVAGIKLKTPATDPLGGMNTVQLIQERLVSELRASGLVSKVTVKKEGQDDAMMKTEIIAFSAQRKGFLSGRIVGISALRVSLESKGKIRFNQVFEKAVTDTDKEYTGEKPASSEQIMADSLREVMKEMLKQMEADIAAWPPDAVITPPPPM